MKRRVRRWEESSRTCSASQSPSIRMVFVGGGGEQAEGLRAAGAHRTQDHAKAVTSLRAHSDVLIRQQEEEDSISGCVDECEGKK